MILSNKKKFFVVKKNDIDIVKKLIESNRSDIDFLLFNSNCFRIEKEKKIFDELDCLNCNDYTLLLDWISCKSKKKRKKVLIFIADLNNSKKIYERYNEKLILNFYDMFNSSKFVSKIIIIEMRNRGLIIQSDIKLEKVHFYEKEKIL
jgi:hypothetical protein